MVINNSVTYALYSLVCRAGITYTIMYYLYYQTSLKVYITTFQCKIILSDIKIILLVLSYS